MKVTKHKDLCGKIFTLWRNLIVKSWTIIDGRL